ncbi:MAG: zinc-dependent peptidase [Betaproteobacteria bacterium]
MKWFTDWRRARILRRAVLDEALWSRVLDRYPFLRALSDEERHCLRVNVMLFLHDKSIHGAGGLEMRDEIRYTVAAQACILTLNLGPDCYRGWVEVIVYPDEFVASYEFVDEDGVAHHVEEPMSGESWLQGPVILSWADAQDAGSGSYNVVIHEFAHKLDMLNGEANGFPPLHADMDREAWSGAFERAYEDFCARVDRGAPLPVDDYAAENPAEFFAVLSEAFFQAPDAIRVTYPDVYRQLVRYYRQDPAARLRGTDRRPHPYVTA